MQEFFASGRVVDVAIAMLALELVLMAWLQRHGGAVPNPVDVAVALAAGLFLLVALRFALTGAGWPLIATALLAALVAHLVDLARRCRAQRGGQANVEAALRSRHRHGPRPGIESTDPQRSIDHGRR